MQDGIFNRERTQRTGNISTKHIYSYNTYAGKKEFDEIFKEKDLFEHIYLDDEEKENFPVDLYNSLNDVFQ